MSYLSDGAITRLQQVAELPVLPARYEIVEEIGRGGMGIVYRARDSVLEREVAVKVLLTMTASHSAAERMTREARIIAALDHPGIVPIYDAGISEDGRPYYVMKLVRGEPLDRASRSLSGGEKLRLFASLCDTVAFAHAAGVVHRDLKPSNVLVGSFDQVMVMDWGIARAVDENHPDGIVMGTPGFMAPEQARGSTVDARADVYALGVMLKMLLSTAKKVARPLSAIARKATAPRAEDRYESAADLRSDLLRYLDGEVVSAYRESPAEKALRWMSNNRTAVTLVATYVVIRVLLYFWMRR